MQCDAQLHELKNCYSYICQRWTLVSFCLDLDSALSKTQEVLMMEGLDAPDLKHEVEGSLLKYVCCSKFWVSDIGTPVRDKHDDGGFPGVKHWSVWAVVFARDNEVLLTGLTSAL